MSGYYSSHYAIAPVVVLFFLLLAMPPATLAQDVCGVVVPVRAAAEIRDKLGGFADFGTFTVPAGSTLRIEANTASGHEVIAVLSSASVGELAFMSNTADKSNTTIYLSYYFPETTDLVNGQIIWKTPNLAENRYSIQVDCPQSVGDSIPFSGGNSQRPLTGNNITPALRPISGAHLFQHAGQGVAHARYNNGIEIHGRDASNKPYIVTFIAPETFASVDSLPEADTLLSYDATLGYAIYRRTTGEYQVNIGPNKRGLVSVTVFDALPPTKTESYTFVILD